MEDEFDITCDALAQDLKNLFLTPDHAAAMSLQTFVQDYDKNADLKTNTNIKLPAWLDDDLNEAIKHYATMFKSFDALRAQLLRDVEAYKNKKPAKARGLRKINA